METQAGFVKILHLTKHIVKNLITESGIIKLKQIYQNFPELILPLCVRSPFLSSLYYVFISSAFRREHHGVVWGKLKYSKELNLAKNSDFLLRRNIHRLEKGLLMKPLRDIFAKDYIHETVNSYKNAFLAKQNVVLSNDSELHWAYDVLKQYFSIVGSEPTIDQARKIFLELPPLNSNNQSVPYKRDLTSQLPVNYDQFLALSYRRRSVRWYLQKPVPRDLLDKAIKAATLSPSACNRQPFEFRIFDEPELVKQVASIPMGTKGFSHNFPAIIVVIGKLRAYFSERDRHIIYIDASLASMSLMYAFETLGLSSCPINWPDIEPLEKQMQSLLKLEPDERVIMLISVGYPDPEGMVAYSQKKPLEQIRKYN
ncbi:nitroreductase family protein [Calothrix sp. FACHB-1219]|uniref:nitroreductase family protein n=1 Tax=unclassified Calothrix TaxID=2619626 RepID=UPI001684DF38|nr:MULTISPECIES: nitroreductase family protein [unclassified Calothrix]MBD2205071.1 nitroreductase family protein [Calothrix sp. FACHB-168]MBD2219869.1 nitroreductase family protein [Calothrix sp. FACHB-1219]